MRRLVTVSLLVSVLFTLAGSAQSHVSLGTFSSSTTWFATTFADTTPIIYTHTVNTTTASVEAEQPRGLWILKDCHDHTIEIAVVKENITDLSAFWLSAGQGNPDGCYVIQSPEGLQVKFHVANYSPRIAGVSNDEFYPHPPGDGMPVGFHIDSYISTPQMVLFMLPLFALNRIRYGAFYMSEIPNVLIILTWFTTANPIGVEAMPQLLLRQGVWSLLLFAYLVPNWKHTLQWLKAPLAPTPQT